MKKLDLVKVGKYVGLALSAIGMIVTGVVTSKENKSTLEKLVNERLNELK